MSKQAQKMIRERTLVLVKPEAVLRSLTGQIMTRLQNSGLKLVGIKMLTPTRTRLEGHFPKDPNWVRGMGEKTLESYVDLGLDPKDTFNTADPMEIGQQILAWNFDYLTMGPVVAMVFEGIHAIRMVRKFIGNTIPHKALPGTIRGDFSINSADLANVIGSACRNIVHASGNHEEAETEIPNWFEASELNDWDRLDTYSTYLKGAHYENEE